jgi:DNA polymerase-1
MFDVVNSETSRFMSNGLITHNSASDLMRFYMPGVVNNKDLKRLESKLVLQVHDEIVLEIPEANADEAVPIVKNILEGSLPGINWVVPLQADIKVASTWSEGK